MMFETDPESQEPNLRPLALYICMTWHQGARHRCLAVCGNACLCVREYVDADAANTACRVTSRCLCRTVLSHVTTHVASFAVNHYEQNKCSQAVRTVTFVGHYCS